MATPESIASSGVMGREIKHDGGWLKRKTVERFLRLFNSQTEQQRMVVMWQMFPSPNKDRIEIPLLRAWLKETAEILGWTDEVQVRRLLGVDQLDPEAVARRIELDAGANALIDELDVAMSVTPPRSTASGQPSPGRPASPSGSDISKTFHAAGPGGCMRI